MSEQLISSLEKMVIEDFDKIINLYIENSESLRYSRKIDMLIDKTGGFRSTYGGNENPETKVYIDMFLERPEEVKEILAYLKKFDDDTTGPAKVAYEMGLSKEYGSMTREISELSKILKHAVELELIRIDEGVSQNKNSESYDVEYLNNLLDELRESKLPERREILSGLLDDDKFKEMLGIISDNKVKEHIHNKSNEIKKEKQLKLEGDYFKLRKSRSPASMERGALGRIESDNFDIILCKNLIKADLSDDLESKFIYTRDIESVIKRALKKPIDDILRKYGDPFAITHIELNNCY